MEKSVHHLFLVLIRHVQEVPKLSFSIEEYRHRYGDKIKYKDNIKIEGCSTNVHNGPLPILKLPKKIGLIVH